MIRTHLWTLFSLALAGSLFAGYLSAGKLFTDTCVIDTSCSYILGVPTCYIGFALFCTLLVLSILLLSRATRTLLTLSLVVGVAGILFSGYYTVVEVLPMLEHGTRYAMLLPTCAYGFVFFVASAVVAYRARTAVPAQP